MQRPSPAANAAPTQAKGAESWLDPVALPIDVLAAIRGRYGAAGLDEVLAVLHWPECHISYECTARAARTLPHRNGHNPGGLFVDLLRKALRGELLIDKADHIASMRAADLENVRQFLYGGRELGELDEHEHRATVELVEELITRSQSLDPEKADTYRAELARLKKTTPKPARLTAAPDEDDPDTEGDDDVAGIPWADLFERLDGELDVSDENADLH